MLKGKPPRGILQVLGAYFVHHGLTNALLEPAEEEESVHPV